MIIQKFDLENSCKFIVHVEWIHVVLVASPNISKCVFLASKYQIFALEVLKCIKVLHCKV